MPPCKGKHLKRPPRHVRNLLNRHVIDFLSGIQWLGRFLCLIDPYVGSADVFMCACEVVALIDL
jgi:hypothetical protein